MVSPDGLRLYVLPQAAYTMSVVDLNPNNTSTYHKVISTANIGQAGQFGDVEITPDGSRIYVAPNYAPGIYVIDTNSSTVVDTVAFDEYTQGYARKIEISPDGTRAYVLVNNVTEGGAVYNAVAVVDIDPNNVATYNTTVATIGGWQPLYGYARPWKDIALSPDGSRLYVTASDGMTVSVINTDTRTVIGTFATDQSAGLYADDYWGDYPRAVTVAPNGTVYVADIEGTVHAVTVGDPTVL